MTTPSKLVIGPLSGGLTTYSKPFFIDNNSFPVVENALCWRQSLIKKPASSLFGILARQFSNVALQNITITTNYTFNLLTDSATKCFDRSDNPIIEPGSVIITLTNSPANPIVWEDKTNPGILTCALNPAFNGLVNYASGNCIVTPSPQGGILTASFSYNPGLPVMGIRPFDYRPSPGSSFANEETVFFDTVYAYQNSGSGFFDVSFYKETGAPLTWNGTSSQQFNSCNYYGALFVTNGNPGFHALPVVAASRVSANVATLQVNGHGLTNGVFAYFFVTQVQGTLAASINGLTGKLQAVVDADNITIVFDASANFPSGATGLGGCIQYLNYPFTVQTEKNLFDGIRWYDGNLGGNGFVNFAPPLDNLNSPTSTYLFGAKIIIPFKNRLVCMGTYEGNLSSSATFYPNRIRYCSVNASPFYSSYTSANSVNVYDYLSWASNIQGHGGYYDLSDLDSINSADAVQGVLILGGDPGRMVRMSDTGVETSPFNFELISPELGTLNPFSTVPMGNGVCCVGANGFFICSSYEAKRFDEDIIQLISTVNSGSQGFDRVSACRDFKNEVIYFSFCSNVSTFPYPNKTLVWNYREGSFAIWDESITAYGNYIDRSITPWPEMLDLWPSYTYVLWPQWGIGNVTTPIVLAGTQQGFVLRKWSDSSANGNSLFITRVQRQANNNLLITSPNHNLASGRSVFFAQGKAPPSFAGIITSSQTNPNNTFIVNLDPAVFPSTVTAGIWQMGLIDNFNVKSKQFQIGWEDGRRTRVGSQQYFLGTTGQGEFTVSLFGSQKSNPSNPDLDIFSSVVRTRPDNNLGLNDTASSQDQLWHRIRSSCVGDTVQLQFTLSPEQLALLPIATSGWVLYSAVLDLYPLSRTLS